MNQFDKKPNKLINATSLYLLQHAYNPVAWQEWGPDALSAAKEQDKPILVSIGYSSCHWCHVMEHESFEHEDVANVMNEYFVCIKVDREERPDIDQVYMEAVQAMGGHGGWPLNVFLTPDQKPFYGGTYFPRANWVHLMRQIQATWLEKRNELEDNAKELTRHLSISDLQRFQKQTPTTKFAIPDLEKMFGILKDRFDTTWGGIEKAPKFVMPSIWQFLLRYHAISKDPEALAMVRFTLIKMQQGGLYDQLGGGFSRYPVDGRWFAPHFEKMLYDNAQLLTLYSEGWSLTQEPSFRRVVYDTVAWLQREMMHPDGGFYSALDADSENLEGKFYTWTYSELEEVLGDDTEALAKYYHATKDGNWEHARNILMDTSGEIPSLHRQMAIDKLLAKRNERIRPGLDDKILTGWNAMTIKGLADAGCAFEEPRFIALAERCMAFLEGNLSDGSRIYRSFKNKRSGTEGFLEDYAFIIQAYIVLYQTTFKEKYLTAGHRWCKYVLENFYDEEDGYFHFSGHHAEQLIARKKEVFDNVIPGSNSVMAQNLFALGTLLDQPTFISIAEKMLGGLAETLTSEPAYLSNWGILMTQQFAGLAEVVIVGKEVAAKRTSLAKNFLPFALIMGAEIKSDLPLFEGREATDGKTRIYVCFNKACQLPVESPEDALQQLNNH